MLSGGPFIVAAIVLIGFGIFILSNISSGNAAETEERIDWNDRSSVRAEWQRASTFHAHCLGLHTEEDKEDLIARVARGEVIEPLSMRGENYWRSLTPSGIRETAHSHHHHFLKRYRELGGRA